MNRMPAPVRAAKLAVVRFERRQRYSRGAVTRSDAVRRCATCGTAFTGRYCPQCGMDNSKVRFSLASLWRDFLGLWDLADRSILRTVRDLFWRPGYMMDDYVSGRRQIYFPPVRLLVVLSLLWVLLAYTLPLEQEAITLGTEELAGMELPDDAVSSLSSLLHAAERWMQDNRAYSLILTNLMAVVAMWVVFRTRRRRLNLAECFYVQMYFCCQLQAVGIVWMVAAAIVHPGSFFPYGAPLWLILLLMVYDFGQLFRLGVGRTVLRVAAMELLSVALNFVVLGSLLFIAGFVAVFQH